jgi:hypothetical protein
MQYRPRSPCLTRSDLRIKIVECAIKPEGFLEIHMHEKIKVADLPWLTELGARQPVSVDFQAER